VTLNKTQNIVRPDPLINLSNPVLPPDREPTGLELLQYTTDGVTL
jgi:hypothetical protein